MSSNINPTNIDSAYPVAGQDNDSQGFRDNFFAIQNNFQAAQQEITDLQNKVILKSALDGAPFDGNDMALANIANVTLKSYTVASVDYSTWNTAVQGSLLLSFYQANYHYVTTAGNITIDLTPSSSGLITQVPNKRAVITLEIDVTSTSHQITLPNSVVNGLEEIAGVVITTGPTVKKLTFAETGVYTFEFSTIDGGSTITILDLSRNKRSIQGNVRFFGPQVDRSYFVANVVTNQNLFANVNHHKFIANTTPRNARVGNLWITLPTGDQDGREIQITSLANIASCFINHNGSIVYFHSNTAFANGNIDGVTATFTWNAANNIWMKF